MKVKYVRVKDDFTLDHDDFIEKLSERTALFSFVHVSNSLGTLNGASFLTKKAKEKNALVVLDAAQSITSEKIDVKEIGCDFLAFSGHKLFGPTGIGVLYGKYELLEKLKPFHFGGGMIEDLDYEKASFTKIPERFEAGTPPIAQTVGLAKAIDYVDTIGIEKIGRWKKKLLDYALKNMPDYVETFVPPEKNRTGVLLFNVKGVHAHDTAHLLGMENICIRAGHHCTKPLIDKAGINAAARASFSIYNTYEDVDKLLKGLEKISKKFS